MQAVKSMVAEIKSRGQLTIPKKIREASHLEEGEAVRLELDEARKQLKKILKGSCLSVEELLGGIKEEREKLSRNP